MHAAKTDITRALLSPGFLVGVLAAPFTMALGAGKSILPIIKRGAGPGLYNGFHAGLVLEGLSSDAMLFIAPILCALPYTAAFVDDAKSGYLRSYLPRAGRAPYLKGKTLACALSGGLALAFGILLGYLVFALVFTPMELAATEEMPAQSMLLPILGRACICFLFGALWSLVGLAMSAATMNRYMAFASPFIFYYVLVILAERYLRDLYVLNPKNWLTASGNWPGGAWGLALFLAVWAGAAAFAFCFTAERRLHDA